MPTQASKVPSTGYHGIPGLSVTSLETSDGLLWVAARPAADNPNVWEVSTAWDRGIITQGEIKAQLGIHPAAKAFTPQFYVASSSARGVTTIAKRAAIGDWEYSPKSAEVVMNNILHLDKKTFAYLSGTTSMPKETKAPLLVANGSLLLQGNDLYYSPEPHAFDIKEGFSYVSKYYYSSTCSVYRALVSLVYVRTHHKK